MAVYTVHAPTVPAEGASTPRPEQFVFVRDGFSFPALMFGALWMLRHRMWLVLLGYIVLAVALASVLGLYGSASVAFIVWTLLALLIGFEAATLRRFTLARRGFRMVGLVVGDDLDLAERRFFDAWVRKQAEGNPFHSGAPMGSGLPVASHGPDVLGLFPEPGAVR
jgi:hypothetical protein